MPRFLKYDDLLAGQATCILSEKNVIYYKYKQIEWITGSYIIILLNQIVKTEKYLLFFHNTK